MRSEGEILVSDAELDRLEAAAQAATALDPVMVLGLIHRLRLAERSAEDSATERLAEQRTDSGVVRFCLVVEDGLALLTMSRTGPDVFLVTTSPTGSAHVRLRGSEAVAIGDALSRLGGQPS